MRNDSQPKSTEALESCVRPLWNERSLASTSRERSPADGGLNLRNAVIPEGFSFFGSWKPSLWRFAPFLVALWFCLFLVLGAPDVVAQHSGRYHGAVVKDSGSVSTVAPSGSRRDSRQQSPSSSAEFSEPKSFPLKPMPLPNSPEEDAVEEILRKGKGLEEECLWADALTLYEDALRNHPKEPELKNGFRRCRFHYDIQRRYSDSSFKELVDQISVAHALALFEEVMSKIQTHHVDGPKWKRLLEHGSENFRVALNEPAFCDYHQIQIDPMLREKLSRQIDRKIANWLIRDRNELKNGAIHIAQLAHEQLGLKPTVVIVEYLCGAANALDPYSAYLTLNQLNDVYSMIDGNFVGLGIELKADDRSLLIVRVIEGSPAQQAGLRDGDRILAVDGHSTRGLNTDEAADLLQGTEDSTARLMLQSDSESPREVRVTRRRVEVPSIEEARMIREEIGFLRLACFQKTTSEELEATLWDLHRQGMKCLIFDLRRNPGGLLSMAIEVADKFVDRGVIVSTRGRNFYEDVPHQATQAGTWNIPLIVLIDHESASAAEIFAGAIRDHHRGTIIGERSYGKGSVQMIFPLYIEDPQTARAGLRLTTEKFYSPRGNGYSGIGVQPDIEVYTAGRPIDGQLKLYDPASATDPDEDPYLQTALETARRILARRGRSEMARAQ